MESPKAVAEFLLTKESRSVRFGQEVYLQAMNRITKPLQISKPLRRKLELEMFVRQYSVAEKLNTPKIAPATTKHGSKIDSSTSGSQFMSSTQESQIVSNLSGRKYNQNPTSTLTTIANLTTAKQPEKKRILKQLLQDLKDKNATGADNLSTQLKRYHLEQMSNFPAVKDMIDTNAILEAMDREITTQDPGEVKILMFPDGSEFQVSALDEKIRLENKLTGYVFDCRKVKDSDKREHEKIEMVAQMQQGLKEAADMGNLFGEFSIRKDKSMLNSSKVSSSPKNLLFPAVNMKSPNLSTISAFNPGDGSFSSRKEGAPYQNKILTIRIPTELEKSSKEPFAKAENSSSRQSKIKIKAKNLLPQITTPRLVRKSIPAPLADVSQILSSPNPKSPLSPSQLPKPTRLMLSRLQQTVDDWKVSKIGETPVNSSGRKRSRRGSNDKIASKAKLPSIRILDELQDPASFADLDNVAKARKMHLPVLDSTDSETSQTAKPNNAEKSRIPKMLAAEMHNVSGLVRVRSQPPKAFAGASPARLVPTKQTALERTFFKTKLSESEAARLAFMVEQVRRDTHDDLLRFTSEFGRRIKDGLGSVAGEQGGPAGKVVFRVTKKVFRGGEAL